MALDMAIKAIIAISQKGFEQEDFHAIMRATAKNNIITFIAANLKTGTIGNQGEGLLPNMKFDEIDTDHYNAIVFVGGGASTYHKNQVAIRLAGEFYEKGGVVAASGDAVPILANAGLLERKTVACDNEERSLLESLAVISEENIFADGRIMTAKRGFGNEFGDKVSATLTEIGIKKMKKKGIEL